ncbi:MAG: DUF2184 domain-containing protein [Spirobacillus cienkowskii]|jgi:hypothetical protein|uniref:DUF2184 domain-containing protein n=1 Tax=Spirobacillus cienkowskii TaxID=495820 RepID=A0A369KW64_9BACT|nr:MAG: DUF2184 domain-containing protein [Spirobacillus cienkowskii]
MRRKKIMQDSIFLEEQLKVIIPQACKTKFPGLTAKDVFPIDYSDGDGVDIIEWCSFKERNISKILERYAAKDTPRVDVSKKNFIEVFSVRSSFSYSIDEIKKAQRTGVSLDAKKVVLALKENAKIIEKLAFKGDEQLGTQGILNHSTIPRFAPLQNSLGKTSWKEKTSQEKLNDLNEMFNTITKTTNEMETPDSVALASDLYNTLHDTPYSDTDAIPIIEIFKQSKPEIKNIYKVPYFNKAGENGSDVIMFFKKDPQKIVLKIPHETEFLPIQAHRLEYVIFTRLRVAGVVVFEPLSCLIGEGF